MISFDQFRANWTGKSVDFDKVSGPQCVDLILQYLQDCYGITGGVSGNAIDYWNKTGVGGFNQVLLNTFSKVHTSEVQQGDIVIFLSVDPDGHVGIATGGLNATDVEILEQNGGGTDTGLPKANGQHWDEIGTRWLARSHVVGVLRPNVAPVTPPPSPPSPKFEVVETYDNGKQIKLNKQPTNLWGMNYDFNFMKDHPVEQHNAGEVWTVTNKVHHVDGYDYYRREGQVDGFNVLDCDDYTPPPPPPPPAPPSAPLPIPTNTTPYEVVKPIRGYGTSNTAINHVDPKATVEEGVYYIFNRRNSGDNTELLAVNVTKTPGTPGAWINVKDNVADPPPPPPEPVKISDWSHSAPAPAPEPELPPEPQPDSENKVRMSMQWFMPNHDAIECEALESVTVTEVFGKHEAIKLTKKKEYRVFATFVKDGRTYALFRLGSDPEFKYLYGVPVHSHVDLGPYLNDIYSVSDRIRYGFEKVYNDAHKTIQGIFKKK